MPFLEANPFHPSLRLQSLGGKLDGLHSMPIILSYCITLELLIDAEQNTPVNMADTTVHASLTGAGREAETDCGREPAVGPPGTDSRRVSASRPRARCQARRGGMVTWATTRPSTEIRGSSPSACDGKNDVETER